MRFDQQLLTPDYLEHEFTLSTLWGLREKLVNFKNSLEKIKDKASNLFEPKRLGEIEHQLFIVNQNIDNVECMMVNKETEIFIVTGMSDICLN
jgi:hypothetical protein